MSGELRLTIATPAAILVDAGNVGSVRAEDESGAFGVLPGHADLLTVLPASVVRWTRDGEPTRYCALSGGVLTITGGNRVAIACRRGALGDDLERLQAKVAAQRAAEIDADRRAKVEQTQLHAQALRQLMRYLRSDGHVLGDGQGPFTGELRPMIASLENHNGKMLDAARVAADRDRKAREDREPTIATRLGQIGVLGWAIVAPILLGVLVGRWLDWTFKTGIFFTAPLDHARRRGRHVDGVAMDAPAMTSRS